MFTGIVEETGRVRTLEIADRTARLDIGATLVLEESAVGSSIAVNGACLTVVSRAADGLAFELGPETLARTALGRLKAGDVVNLERPLKLGGPLGGHLVLGHVDGVGAVEGVSLTVAKLDGLAFEVMLIPHTLASTTLGRLARGQAVNIEADVIGKYVLRSVALRGAR